MTPKQIEDGILSSEVWSNKLKAWVGIDFLSTQQNFFVYGDACSGDFFVEICDTAEELLVSLKRYYDNGDDSCEQSSMILICQDGIKKKIVISLADDIDNS